MKDPRRSKLETANLLMLGMEGLRADGLVPVSKTAVADAGSVEAAVDRQRIGAALTATVLYAIVVELVVKHCWERETGKAAPHSHNVNRLFQELSSKTQLDMETLYEQCCLPYAEAVRSGQRQLGHGTVAVEIASLKEALQWNEDAVKNLKYDLTPRGRSVPTGLFWSRETVWVVPGGFPNFAIELTRWANGHMS